MRRRLAKCVGILLPVLAAGCQRAAQPLELSVVETAVQVGEIQQHFVRGGRGAPLLLIHGLTNTWRVWRPYLSALGDTRDLLIPDLRGHGHTANPSQTLSSRQIAENMFGLMDALGIQKIQVVGYSLGGHVALRMAAMQPERIEAAVVVAGLHQLLGSARPFHETALQTELTSDWWLNAVSAWHPGGEAQVRRVYREGVAAILADDFALTEAAMASIRARTLIIHGDRDEVLPLEVPLDMFRKIQGAQLWIIPNATHSAVFWQDVAPPGTDFGGGVFAGRQFPEAALAFLGPRTQ